jgi:TPR repeat protein
LLYDYGEGVPQNKAEALKLYRLAAKQGHIKAKSTLAETRVSKDSDPT